MPGGWSPQPRRPGSLLDVVGPGVASVGVRRPRTHHVFAQALCSQAQRECGGCCAVADWDRDRALAGFRPASESLVCSGRGYRPISADRPAGVYDALSGRGRRPRKESHPSGWASPWRPRSGGELADSARRRFCSAAVRPSRRSCVASSLELAKPCRGVPLAAAGQQFGVRAPGHSSVAREEALQGASRRGCRA